MNITTERTPDTTEIVLEGRFDAHDVDDFRTQLDTMLAAGSTHITVDLEEVNFLDSSALAELVRGMKHTRQEGGDLILRRPSDPVRVILELTGLDKAFSIVSS